MFGGLDIEESRISGLEFLKRLKTDYMSGIEKQEQAGWKCRKLFSERKVSSFSFRRRALPVVDMVCVLTELRMQKRTEEVVIGVEKLKKQRSKSTWTLMSPTVVV